MLDVSNIICFYEKSITPKLKLARYPKFKLRLSLSL